MSTLSLSIDGMTCGHCVAAVKRALEAVPGVQVSDVAIGSARIQLPEPATEAQREAVLESVRDAGYEPEVVS